MYSISFMLNYFLKTPKIRVCRQWQPTPVLFPGKSHGRRSLEGCSPWGHKELDTSERLHFHFSLSCIGEGNGNAPQCSYLENPRDGGAWWAAVYGVTQSQTRLKWVSSSSSSIYGYMCSGFPRGASGKEPACQCRRHKRCRFSPWIEKLPWRRAWQLTPEFLPGESHGQRILDGWHDWSDLACIMNFINRYPNFEFWCKAHLVT